MSEKIGRFEIVSQLAQSPFATVYKTMDVEAQQIVALKVIHLEKMTDRAALTKTVFEEAEQAKSLSSHNIAGLYGVGDEGDLLLAAAEYIQGNSVATTLARNEGFSIWDLQDIARQVCQALDHAHGHKVVHQSLEPAKIMVQWDGLVKVLGFGISSMNATAAPSETVPDVMHYFSPEHLRSETLDHRSAIFSLGAVLYEMATEQKAFAGKTPDEVRAAILEGTPPLPHRLKGNVNPALSNLIMKALAKSPDERFQSGQELVKELEQCKSSGGLAAKQAVVAAVKAPPREAAKANAAAAASTFAGAPKTTAPIPSAPEHAPKAVASPGPPNIRASAAPAVEETPAFSVDPMMAEGSDASTPRTSFSEISELPPLKEVYVAQPAPPANEELDISEPTVTLKKADPKKPRVHMRDAARKAVNAIRKTPPKWYLYSVSCAVFFIALYLAGMTLYNHIEDKDTNGTPVVAPLVPEAQPAPAPAPQNVQPQTGPTQNAQEQTSDQSDVAQPATSAEEPAQAVPGRRARGRKTISRPVVATVPGQLSVISTPAGAKISFDGSELCQTPCTLTGIAPGQHTITASKSGFATVNRNLAMLSGANSSVALELNPVGASLSVNSTPAGAVILLDGKDTGKLTPSLFTVGKSGTHTVTLQRAGYLDNSSTVNLEAGGSASVNLTLTHLGNTDEIRSAGGHFKKVFGGNSGDGMGVVSIKTQPKGAQIMVNNRVLDKTSPFDFYLNPGTYVLDITMSGYQPLHRVITIQEAEKVAIQETLSAQ